MFSLIPEWLFPAWVTGMSLTSLWLTVKGVRGSWRWLRRRARGELARPADTLRAAAWCVGGILIYAPAVYFWPATVTLALADRWRDRRRRVRAARAEETGLLDEIRRARTEGLIGAGETGDGAG